MNNKPTLSPRKLFIGVALTIVVAVLGPILFAHLGWVRPLDKNGWWVLSMVVVGLLLKLLAGDVASGDFLFHKNGYDNCIMTVGASLTALALQLTSDKDLFPGLSTAIGLWAVPATGSGNAKATIALLITFFVGSLVATFLTARVSRFINDTKHYRGLGPLFNSVVGLGLLGFYILLLVAKG